MATDRTTVTFGTDCNIRIYSVECNERGHGELSICSVTGDDPEEIMVVVEPCEKCLKDAECGREHAR